MSQALFTIDGLHADDYAAWLVLAQGYKTFYETSLPDAAYQQTWRRIQDGDGIFAWCARRDGRLLGITHYLFHPSAWSAEVCYLQDLFVAEAARGQGVAQALIERVAQAARERGAPRLYWLTHQTNACARRLYDRLGQHQGFIRYDFPMA